MPLPARVHALALAAAFAAATALPAQSGPLLPAPPNTQQPTNAIPTFGTPCGNCVIRNYDMGFVRFNAYGTDPRRVLRDLRGIATVSIDPVRSVRAPNGQGGEEVINLADLGLTVTREVTLEFQLSARNPETGAEAIGGTITMIVQSDKPETRNIDLQVSNINVSQASERYPDLAALYNHL